MRDNKVGNGKEVSRKRALELIQEKEKKRSRDKFSDTDEERRSFLTGAIASVGSTFAAFLGGTGFVSGGKGGKLTGEEAKKEMEMLEEVEEPYRTAEKVQMAVKNNGVELLNTLAELSLLSTGSMSELPLERVLSDSEYLQANEGVHVGAVRVDGTPTAHISITKQLSVGKLVVFVQPHVSQSYAIHRTDDGITFISSDGATTQTCHRTVCHCSYTSCSCGKWPEKRDVYCDGTCYKDDCAWGDYQGCCEETCNSFSCAETCDYAC